MSELYHPSSGTEGMDFTGKWCARCACDVNDDCSILAASFCGPVDEWQYERGEPVCTAFVAADPLGIPTMRSAAVADLFPGSPRRPSQGEQVRLLVSGFTEGDSQ